MHPKQMLPQRPCHRRIFNTNIQLAVHLHTARIDVRGTQRGEHVIDDHQLAVHIHIHPVFRRGIWGHQGTNVHFQAGNFRGGYDGLVLLGKLFFKLRDPGACAFPLVFQGFVVPRRRLVTLGIALILENARIDGSQALGQLGLGKFGL
ncbi:hypothetical protein D3C80_922870 [compost metagenome]